MLPAWADRGAAPTGPAMSTEIELKLALDPAAMPALLRHPAVTALSRARMRTTRLASVYYDTPNCLLAAEGIALRARRDGKRWVQTIKGPPEVAGGGGLQARAEYEWPLPGPALDLTRLAATPWRKLIAIAEKRGLVRCFTTDFERRTVPLRFPDGTLALLCVDRGEIRAARDGRTRRVPIAEIEIELETGAAANLFGLALALAADLPLAVMAVSKADRGHAVRRGERDLVTAPAKARGIAFAEHSPTVDVLSQLARECLQQIAANAAGLLEDDDPEWVHQMRIGTRRLRSCLALVAHLARSAALDFIVTEVKWLAGVLGTARDWDVFINETLPPLTAALARDATTAAALKRLRARALARGRAARAAARDAIASPRFHRLLLAGGLLCATPRFGTRPPAVGAVETDALSAPADAFARTLLARRHRKLQARAAALAHGSPEERHAVRIAAKRLRYVAEFFSPLFPRKRVKPYLKALTALQDVLGRLNDTATALRVASETGGPAADVAAGAVRGWVAAQAAALDPDLARSWRRFADAKPFWSRR
jgi:inorganic triphosphatase YgiF